MNERELQFHKVYMNIANEIATLSRANKRKVGCIIVKDGNIIGIGFNGTPSGFDNECEVVRIESDCETEGIDINMNQKLITKPEVLHAESNALMKVTCSTQSSIGADLYVTYEPCIDCAKLIIQAKISRVFYHVSDKRCNDGINLLSKAKIEIHKI